VADILTANSAHIYKGMDKILETLDNIGLKLFVLAALTQNFSRIIRYSFVCLQCVVPVSVH
jgi:hypothetical protein